MTRTERGEGRARATPVDQERQRHIARRLTLGHVLSGFLVDRHMWSSAEASSIEQSIRTLDGQHASELRYAAAVAIWV